MSKTRIAGAAGLTALAGQSLGTTEWKPLPFEQIQAFAGATLDHQWIHVDLERIAKESPYGRPLAHGYLTMSLIGGLFFELVELEGFKLVINYGANKVRFPAPLRAGDQYRLAMAVTSVKELGDGWYETLFAASVEVEGSKKPACAAEVIYRFQA